jgi:hypothetical protein
MPKSKEFFSLLKDQGKINNPKFDELLEKLPDFEIDPDAQRAFEESFMTVERAASHNDVKRKIRLETLLPIDRDMEKIISAIGAYDKATADKLESLTRDVNAQGHRPPDTYKRLELLSNSLGEVLSKVKTAPAGGDEELKKKLQKSESSLQEALEKLTESEKQYNSGIKAKEKEFETRLHDFKLDSELEKLSGTFTFAEAYEKSRKDLSDAILSSLKKTNSLKLGTKDGQTVVQVYDESGAPRYNGNSPVTINQLLEEKYKPFLKQSNADNGNQSHQANTQTFTSNGNPNPLQGRGASTVVK